MRSAIQEFGRDAFQQETWDWLAERTRYVATDFSDEGGQERLVDVAAPDQADDVFAALAAGVEFLDRARRGGKAAMVDDRVARPDGQ